MTPRMNRFVAVPFRRTTYSVARNGERSCVDDPRIYSVLIRPDWESSLYANALENGFLGYGSHKLALKVRA